MEGKPRLAMLKKSKEAGDKQECVEERVLWDLELLFIKGIHGAPEGGGTFLVCQTQFRLHVPYLISTSPEAQEGNSLITRSQRRKLRLGEVKYPAHVRVIAEFACLLKGT